MVYAWLPNCFETKGMLQGFYEEKLLFDVDEAAVASTASVKAAELAMLGLTEEANSIMSLVAAHAVLDYKHDVRLEFFWAESDTPRLAPGPIPFENAASSEEDRLNLDNFFPHRIPQWSFTEKSFHEISKIVEELTKGAPPVDVTDATHGSVAEKLSDAYTALLSIALHHGWDDKAAKLMAKIASRIHADMQSQRLGLVRPVWGKYLLSGWLRDAIGVDLQAVREYARFIHDTIERRLKSGPLGPLRSDILYKDWTIRQIVEEIDRNTMAGIRHESKDSLWFCDPSNWADGQIPATITRKPATMEQIQDAESRIGRALPVEMREFYRVTDGFHILKCKSSPAYFQVKLPPLAAVWYEDDEWMTDGYALALVQDLNDVSWPTVTSGVAFYEHDGQGTLYTWIVGSEIVAKAKEALWAFHETASDEKKREIERQVANQFGSREALDKIVEYCVYEQLWGSCVCRAYPTFRAYLESLAFGIRDAEERSPLKTEFISCYIH